MPSPPPPDRRRVYGHGLVRAPRGRRRRSAFDYAPPRRRTRCQVRAKNERPLILLPCINRPGESLRDRAAARMQGGQGQGRKEKGNTAQAREARRAQGARLSLFHSKPLHIPITSPPHFSPLHPALPFLLPLPFPLPYSNSASLSWHPHMLPHSILLRNHHLIQPLFPNQPVLLPHTRMCVFAFLLCVCRSTTVSPERSAAQGVSGVEG